MPPWCDIPTGPAQLRSIKITPSSAPPPAPRQRPSFHVNYPTHSKTKSSLPPLFRAIKRQHFDPPPPPLPNRPGTVENRNNLVIPSIFLYKGCPETDNLPPPAHPGNGMPLAYEFRRSAGGSKCNRVGGAVCKGGKSPRSHLTKITLKKSASFNAPSASSVSRFAATRDTGDRLHWKLTLVKILCHREFIHSPGRYAPVTDDRRSAKVDTHDISRNELKELIREAIISTLTERRDLLEDALPKPSWT